MCVWLEDTVNMRTRARDARRGPHHVRARGELALELSVGASESQVSTTQGEGRLVCARTRVSSRQVTCGSCCTREQPAERIPRHGWVALPAPRRIKLKRTSCSTCPLVARVGDLRAGEQLHEEGARL